MAGTFSFEQKDFVTDGRILANNVTTPETWTVVNTNDIVAVVDDQQFVSFEKAVDYAAAKGKTIVSFKRSYDQAGETNIVFTFDMATKAVTKKLEFNPAGFAFPGELVAAGYVTAMNASRRLYLAPEGSLVARIGERPSFTNIADAVAVSTNGAMVTLLKDWTENVTVSDNKTNSFSFGAFELNGDLKATGAADKIVVLDGTNTYASAFTGTNLEFAEDTVFGYKQSRDYIADDMAMARTETNRWQVVDTNRLTAASNGEKFLSLEDAARLADNGARVDLLTNRVDTFKLTQTEIDKNLLFNTNGFAFLSSPYLAKADGVDGDYAVAQTAEGYYYLTPVSNVVAKLDNGTLYTNVAAAVAMAVDGETVTLLTNWTENVTVNGQTNKFSFGAFEFNGDLTTDAAGRIVVVDGTNAYASAFAGPNLELRPDTTYGFKQLADFLPSDEFALAKTATNRWTVVETNDLAVAIGDPTDYANYQVFTSPEEAIALAGYGDTLVFLKKWDKDVTVDDDGLAKNLKFHPGSFAQAPMRIKAEGYRLVQDGDRLFTLKPLGWVASAGETEDEYLEFQTFLDAMDYIAMGGSASPVITFLQDFPDNILIPDEYVDAGFEFNPAGFAFPGELVYNEDYTTAMNDATNLFLAATNDIVAVYNYYRPRFTNVVTAVNLATNGTVVTVVKDCAGDATAQTDITLETENGAVYGGPFFNGGHSVKTTLGSLFGTNLIEELDWTDSGLTLINQTNGIWKVCSTNDAMAQVRWTNRPTEVFDSVQSAFAWLRKFVDANPAEALNTYGIDVIGGGEQTLDLAGQQLNWSINVSNETSTTTVTNGEIYGDFPVVRGEVGTVVFGEGLLMTNRVPKVFKEPAAPETGVRLWTEKGVYKYDPTAYCREGFVGAMRADRLYRIEAKGDVQIIMTDRSGADIHFKTLQDAFDVAPTLSTLRLYNNGAITATNAHGRSFRITSDAVGSDGNGATTVSGGEIVLADGTLLVSNIVFDTAKIIVKGGEGCIFTAGDDLEIKNAMDGAVVVEDGARMVVDGKNIQIWDNNGTNVVVRNPATGLVLVRDDNISDSSEKSHIGIWCENFEAGQLFGMVAPNFAYPFFCDGDITVAEPQVYFTNDRDAALHHGKGKTVDRGLVYKGTNSVRWIGGFAKPLFEGHALITRTGDELVWLAATNPPPADPVEVVGRTAHTLSFVAEKGCDYAVVTNGMADTNWVSITDATLGLNGNDGTFTFTNLAQFVNYTFLKRYSITESTMISSNVTIGVETTSSEDIDELIRDFGFDPDRNLWKEFLDIVPDGNYPYDGYIVTLKKDIAHGAVLPDDIGRLVIRLDGHFLSAASGKNGIDFRHSTEEPFLREYRDQLQANVSVLGGGRVVGGEGVNGRNATHTREGTVEEKTAQRGGCGIAAEDGCEKIELEIAGGIEIYGGGYFKKASDAEFGNGGFGIEEDGGAGCDGSVGVGGTNVFLTVDNAFVKGGDGGNGGSSTKANGGNGGGGASAIGGQVEIVKLRNATFVGGKGGNGGDSAFDKSEGDALDSAKAGDGGKGGDGLDPKYADLARGRCSFSGGEGGAAGANSHDAGAGTAGDRGISGKPAAPVEDVEILALTGESILFTAEPFMIYDLIDARGNLLQSVTNETAEAATNMFGDIGGPLGPNRDYVIRNRFMSNGDRGEAESYAHRTRVATAYWDSTAIKAMFDGNAEVTIDDEGCYLITLTDDLAHGVALPSNLGKVTLDLGGSAITGTDGRIGAPGRDGEPAIAIARFRGRAKVDSPIGLTLAGEGVLQGGNGGDAKAENPLDARHGGNGAPAIANEARGMIVVVLDGPTLQGGRGGNGDDALTGDGGRGGNGGDAVGRGIFIDYVSGDAIGGRGGNGGNSRDPNAAAAGGNGGQGGDANVFDENGDYIEGSTGGNGGDGGYGPRLGNVDPVTGRVIDNAGAGANWGIPGGVRAEADEPVRDICVRTGYAEDVGNVRYYYTLEDALLDAEDAFDQGIRLAIAAVRDCTLGDTEVLTDGIRLSTENGATISLVGELRLRCELNQDGNTNFTFEPDCAITGGRVVVDCTVDVFGGDFDEMLVTSGGSLALYGGKVDVLTVEKGGACTLKKDGTGATVGDVTVEEGGRFTVAYQAAKANVTGTITAAVPKDVFLFAGTYDVCPTGEVNYVRAPFKVTGDGPYVVEQDMDYHAMAVIDNEVIPFKTVDEAFAAVSVRTASIDLELLQDSTNTTVLSDQKAARISIAGNGYTLTDARSDANSEIALFNLSGDLTVFDLTIDGAGQKGRLVSLMESKDVAFYNCTITGYDCQALNGDGPIPLIAASAAGAATRLILRDTEITGNSFSFAVDTTDLSGSGFTYPVYVSGRTTITENNGKPGIHSDGPGQIVLDGGLYGGFIDVVYAGYGGFPGIFAEATWSEAEGADLFRYLDQKTCGKLVVDEKSGKALIVWDTDPRQYAAQVVIDGESTFHETLAEAFGYLNDNGAADNTVIIHRDARIAERIDVCEDVTVDLNGHTLVNVDNGLQFIGETAVVSNGSLTAESKYALYVYDGTVKLGANVTVEGDVYVARGLLEATDPSVGVKGSIVRTNYGTVSLVEGCYTEDVMSYLAAGRALYPCDEEGYAYRIGAAVMAPGFADGFIPEAEVIDGKTVVDLSESGVGMIRTDGNFVLGGDRRDDLEVIVPTGWKVAGVVYESGSDTTTVTFGMDVETLRPVLGSSDPSERVLEFPEFHGRRFVVLRIKNAVPGFYYQLKATKHLGRRAAFDVLTEKQADTFGNLELVAPVGDYHFFRPAVTDRSVLGN